MRPTPRPPSPSPRRHRESSFFAAALGLSKCGNSFWGSMRASGVPARWRSRGKGGRQDTKNRTGAHSGGACRRHVQTLVCTPDDTRHTACTTIAKIKSAMCHGALWPYRAVHCAIRCPVIRREAAVIAHAWSMQSIIKVSWIVGFIKIGHQIRDPRWRKPLGTYPGPRWMSPPP